LNKAEAQAYLTGERAEPPITTVEALLLDTQANVARRVTVSPEENRVLSVEEIAPTLVPFTPDDLHAAWNLARRDPAIQQALGPDIDRYHIALPDGLEGKPFVIQALPRESGHEGPGFYLGCAQIRRSHGQQSQPEECPRRPEFRCCRSSRADTEPFAQYDFWVALLRAGSLLPDDCRPTLPAA
jgi:hypothetical protein